MDIFSQRLRELRLDKKLSMKQLAKEIKENSWLIGKAGKETLLNQHFRDLWHTSLNEMGGKYAIWARYPQYPSLN